MKKLLAFAVASFIFFSTEAQQLTTPQTSPTTEIKQNFALSSIELSFSRPGVKGRKIFGDLVPYGKVWRTGANSATTITFGEDVTIGGKKVAAGKYGLLSIPGQTEWTFIITKQLDVTSPAAYKQDQDVVRVTSKPAKTLSHTRPILQLLLLMLSILIIIVSIEKGRVCGFDITLTTSWSCL